MPVDLDQGVRYNPGKRDSHVSEMIKKSPGTEDSTRTAAGPHSPENLIGAIYDDLRRIARDRLAKLPPGQTLQPTAVVHEAYIKLAGENQAHWPGRTVFLSAAARAMRDIIVDHVRRRLADKRGGGRQKIEFEGLAVPEQADGVDVIALDELLKQLQERDKRLSELVTLRYFGGASIEQAAETLGISLATANRDWRYAKAWLLAELQKGETGSHSGHQT